MFEFEDDDDDGFVNKEMKIMKIMITLMRIIIPIMVGK